MLQCNAYNNRAKQTLLQNQELSRLLHEQHSDHHTHFCVRCLQGFSSERVLEQHRTLCLGSSGRPTRVVMPEKGKNTLRFTNFQNQMKAPYIIYADVESIIQKFDTCIPPTEKSSTTKTEVHKPCGPSFAVESVMFSDKQTTAHTRWRIN